MNEHKKPDGREKMPSGAFLIPGFFRDRNGVFPDFIVKGAPVQVQGFCGSPDIVVIRFQGFR